jgi:hypothetical protein
MAKQPSSRFTGDEAEFDFPSPPAAPSGTRRLLIGLGLGGGALLLLFCCVCGSVGAWFGVSHYRATATTSPFTDSGKGTDGKKIADANFSKIKTGMMLEEVEGILGKGSPTTQAELYNLWQHNQTTTTQVERTILYAITRWYVWNNGNLFLAVGLSATHSRIDHVSVIVYRDSHGAIRARGGDPEVRP